MAAAIAIPTDTVPEADAQSPTLTTASSAAVITPEVPVANLPKTTTPKKRRNSNSQSRHPAGKIISQAGRLALIAYLLKVAFDAAHDNAEQAARTVSFCFLLSPTLILTDIQTGLTVEQVQWHINNNVHSVRSRLIGYLKSLVRGHTRTRKPQNKPQNKNNTDPKTEDEEAPKNNPARQ
jgi:hypothetical protein